MRPLNASPWSFAMAFGILLFAAPVLTSCSDDGATPDNRIPVRAMVVGSASQSGESAGPAYAATIASRFESDLGFRVAGRVVSRRVSVGDPVRAGNALATLDPASLRTLSQSANAAVAAARAELAQAESDVVRNMPLASEQIIAAAEMERLRTQRATARARLQEAQARAAGARDDLSYATLRSPVDGIVTAVSAEVGQYLAPGQIMFRIARPTALDAVVDVPESVITGLRAGMPAVVTLASVDGTIAARVREIAPAADAATRTYRVKLALLEPAPARIGMTARVRFPALTQSGSLTNAPALLVPRAAIASSARRPAVWIIGSNGQISLRPVTLGAFVDDNVTVASGLRPGEHIVTAGVHRLDARQRVRLWDGKLP